MNAKRAGGVGPGGPRDTRDRVPRIFDIVRKHNMKTAASLQAYALKEADEGRTALAELCTKHGAKLHGFVKSVWAVIDAPERLLRADDSRLDKLRRAADERACECGGDWTPGVTRILTLNGIDVGVFCGAICRALQLGAKRGANIACIGDAGCGKSTLLEAFEFIFDALEKPQFASTFPLGNLPGKDIILWQDFEFNERALQFTDLLSLFVGESLDIRRPSDSNTKWRNTAPIFHSARVPLACARQKKRDQDKLNQMMNERFETFLFDTPLPMDERDAGWVHCPKCCATFHLRGPTTIQTQTQHTCSVHSLILGYP